MPGPRSRRIGTLVRTPALVVRRTAVGEADVLVTLVTRERGLVSASARSARRAASKLGPLEPMHTLEVGLTISQGSDIAKLTEAKITKPRMALVDDPTRLDVAARVLAWARSLVPAHSAEPRAFDVVEGLLDALTLAPIAEVEALVARAGLELLAALGLGLELSRCVGCGTGCPAGTSAYVDVGRGGIVCRACGGAREILPAATRLKLDKAARGVAVELDVAEIAVARRLVEDSIGLAGGRSSAAPGPSHAGRVARRSR